MVAKVVVVLLFLTSLLMPIESFGQEDMPQKDILKQSAARQVWIQIEETQTKSSEIVAGVIVNSTTVITSPLLSPEIFLTIHRQGLEQYRLFILTLGEQGNVYPAELKYINSDLVILNFLPAEKNTPLILSQNSNEEEKLVAILRDAHATFFLFVDVVDIKPNLLKVRYYGFDLLPLNAIKISKIINELKMIAFWTFRGEFVGFANLEELHFIYFHLDSIYGYDLHLYIDVMPIYFIPVE